MFKVEQINADSKTGQARRGKTEVVTEDQLEGVRTEMRELMQRNPRFACDTIRVTAL